MHSPFIGLLLQHGHITNPELIGRLSRPAPSQLRTTAAAKRLLTPDADAKRTSWRATVSAARYLFLINSP